MSDKKQTAVEWFSNRAYELFEQYSEGKLDRITLNKLMFQATEQSKQMEKEQIVNARQSHPIEMKKARWMVDISDGEQYYEQTYGGN